MTESLTIAKVDRPCRLYPKASLRLSFAEESNFPEWLQSHTRYTVMLLYRMLCNLR